MTDVKDLKSSDLLNSAPTGQTISLSAISAKDAPISINATNGLSGVSEDTSANRPVIKISPTRRKPHRTSNDPSEIESRSVNPDDYFEKKEVKTTSPQEIAMNLLDQTINRKKQEYLDFVNNAIKDDEINRERVEDGLEDVEGNLDYIPNTMKSARNEFDDEDENIEDEDRYTEDEDSFDEDDIDNYVVDDNNEVDIPSNIRIEDRHIHDNFYTDEEDDSYESEKAFDEEEVLESFNEYMEDEEETEYEAVEDTEEIEYETVENTEEEKQYVDDEEKSEYVDPSVELLNVPTINVTMPSELNTEGIDEDLIEDEDKPFADISEDSIDDEVDEEEYNKLSNIGLKNLKSEILEKIINAGRKLDTTQFVVSNKVVSAKDVLKKTPTKIERTNSWPLMYANRPFKASALKGPEVAILADYDTGDGNISVNIDQLRIMYQHDVNKYRPTTLEAWAKSIPYGDIENIFAALYVASMKDSNYIPQVCTNKKCAHAFLTDNIDVNSMVHFTNKESEEKFNQIKKIPLTIENSTSYESVINVINDQFAVGIKVPSIYNVVFEHDSLSEEFIDKYNAMVSIIQYIDYIYYIDPETSQFQPIGWKTYTGDVTKSYKSKIATYAKILKEFDETEFSIIISLISSMIDKSTELKTISYVIPKSICPKCGMEIKESAIRGRGLVFMRQRLVELAITPSEK